MHGLMGTLSIALPLQYTHFKSDFHLDVLQLCSAPSQVQCMQNWHQFLAVNLQIMATALLQAALHHNSY